MRDPSDIFRKGQRITGRDLIEATEVNPRAIRGGSGIKVRRDVSGNTVISLREQGGGGGGAATARQFAFVISYVPLIGDAVWRYTMRTSVLQNWSLGPLGWATPQETIDFEALNLSESSNSPTGINGSGIQGNGVNINNLPGTFVLQPIPIGARVEVYRIDAPSGQGGYFFDRPNATDGACEVP